MNSMQKPPLTTPVLTVLQKRPYTTPVLTAHGTFVNETAATEKRFGASDGVHLHGATDRDRQLTRRVELTEQYRRSSTRQSVDSAGAGAPNQPPRVRRSNFG